MLLWEPEEALLSNCALHQLLHRERKEKASMKKRILRLLRKNKKLLLLLYGEQKCNG